MIILVLSDNHGDQKVLLEILKREKYDKAIHLGDAELSANFMDKYFDYYVCGNHDFFLNQFLIVDFGNIKTYLCHGHLNFDILSLNLNGSTIKNQKQINCFIHGHTHIPRVVNLGNQVVLCPGSTNLPRSNEGPTYMLLEINDVSNLHVAIKSAIDFKIIREHKIHF